MNREELITLLRGEKQTNLRMTKTEAIRFCYEWAVRDPEGLKEELRKEQRLVVDRDTTISCRSHSEEEVERIYNRTLEQGRELIESNSR